LVRSWVMSVVDVRGDLVGRREIQRRRGIRSRADRMRSWEVRVEKRKRQSPGVI
jgi:hypothetical protein